MFFFKKNLKFFLKGFITYEMFLFFLTLIAYFHIFSPVANSAMKNSCSKETRLHFSGFPLEFYIRTFSGNHDHISLMEIGFKVSQNID